jgi:hypothetical protein
MRLESLSHILGQLMLMLKIQAIDRKEKIKKTVNFYFKNLILPVITRAINSSKLNPLSLLCLQGSLAWTGRYFPVGSMPLLSAWVGLQNSKKHSEHRYK